MCALCPLWTGVCTDDTGEKGTKISLIIQDDLLELCIKFHSVKVYLETVYFLAQKQYKNKNTVILKDQHWTTFWILTNNTKLHLTNIHFVPVRRWYIVQVLKEVCLGQHTASQDPRKLNGIALWWLRCSDAGPEYGGIAWRLGRHYEDAALCSKNHIQICQPQTQKH